MIDTWWFNFSLLFSHRFQFPAKLEQESASLQVKLEAANKRHKREIEDTLSRAQESAQAESQVSCLMRLKQNVYSEHLQIRVQLNERPPLLGKIIVAPPPSA